MTDWGEGKRRYARVPFYGTAAIQLAHQGWQPVTLLDLSLKGAQIQAPPALTPGQPLTLKLSLDDSPIELRINAQVQRVDDGSNGLAFLPLPEATLHHLHRLLELNLGSDHLFES